MSLSTSSNPQENILYRFRLDLFNYYYCPLNHKAVIFLNIEGDVPGAGTSPSRVIGLWIKSAYAYFVSFVSDFDEVDAQRSGEASAAVAEFREETDAGRVEDVDL